MNSPIKIEINGVLITGRIDGTESFEVTIRENDQDGTIAKTFSSELTFYDDGYYILKTFFIDDPNGFSNSVNVKVFDDCCLKEVFSGVIKGDSIDWCEPDCYISANIVEEKPEINCLRSTIIWDNYNNFLDVQRPAVRYCIENRPGFIQVVLVWVTFVLNYLLIMILIPLLAIVFTLSTILFFICSVVCAIPGTACTQNDCTGSVYVNPIQAVQQILDIFNEVRDVAIPCGRFHPSPLVRDYIKNVCDKCGLTFQSSILNDPSSPYYDTLLFAAQVKKGSNRFSTSYLPITENLPVETLETLMNNVLKPTFNANFWVIGNNLIFERKDYFTNVATWIDSEQIYNEGRIIDNKICFSWQDRERWAFGRFEYQPDAQDYIGNEAKPRFDDIVDFNNPYSPAQSGQLEVQIPLSPARFRDDQIETDIYSYFATMFGGIVDFFFGGVFSQTQDFLLLNQDTAFNYKLLIWDSTSGIAFAKIKRFYPDLFTGGDVNGINPLYRFNYPFWFKENRLNNLYSLFHYIDDPRNPLTQQFDFNFQFEFNCDEYLSFNFSKSVRMIKGGNVAFGLVKELKVDFAKRIISVSGIV